METQDTENTLVIGLAAGDVVIELFPDVAPLHVERIKTLARTGQYDNVAFHRVIDGFVAQTGDVQFGDVAEGYDPGLVGRGGSDLPDLPAEFSAIPFERGVVGMARGQSPDSANSQFFIMFEEASFLNGQYTVVGRVVEGMELVDGIKRGDGPNGLVTAEPDRIVAAEIVADGLAEGLSPEEAQVVALLYEGALDRDGDIDGPGLNFWIDRREGPVETDDGRVLPQLSERDLALRFLAAPEFEAAYGEALDPAAADYLEDESFVRTLYLNLLGRDPLPDDKGGFEFWLGRLAAEGVERQDILLSFVTSEENVREGDLGFVETLAEVEPGEWAFS